MYKFKNILFDYGGVLIKLTPERCFKAFQDLGCPASIPANSVQHEIFRRIDRGTATEAEFYDEIRRLGKIPQVSDTDILNAWNLFIFGVSPHTFEALKKLKDICPLYILSNCNVMHWRHCREHLMDYQGENTLNWFQHIFLSFEMHLEKPERAIYDTVCQQANLCAADTLFIDDREDNILGASQAGFQTLQSQDGDWIEKLGLN